MSLTWGLFFDSLLSGCDDALWNVEVLEIGMILVISLLCAEPRRVRRYASTLVSSSIGDILQQLCGGWCWVFRLRRLRLVFPDFDLLLAISTWCLGSLLQSVADGVGLRWYIVDREGGDVFVGMISA